MWKQVVEQVTLLDHWWVTFKYFFKIRKSGQKRDDVWGENGTKRRPVWCRKKFPGQTPQKHTVPEKTGRMVTLHTGLVQFSWASLLIRAYFTKVTGVDRKHTLYYHITYPRQLKTNSSSFTVAYRPTALCSKTYSPSYRSVALPSQIFLPQRM